MFPFLMEFSPAVLEQIRQSRLPATRQMVSGRPAASGSASTSPAASASSPQSHSPASMPWAQGFVLSAEDEKRLAQLIAAPATALT